MRCFSSLLIVLTQDSVMQPIIILGIIAVIGIFAGTGFLAPAIDMVWVQTIGVGDADLESPLHHAGVDLDIAAFPGVGPNGQPIFKNKFVSCSFHAGTQDFNTLQNLDKVICKLTDINNKVIAEQFIQFCPDPVPIGGCGVLPTWTPSTQYIISPLVEAYPGALNIDNVEDVRLVVLGDDPTDNP